MKSVYAILYMKGDWAEYNSTFGLPNWRDALRPCFKCRIPVDLMYEIQGLTRRFCGNFKLNVEGEYDEACDRCEVVVVLSKTLHALLLPLLFYDA